MKKFLALILALVMALSLVACGGGTSSQDGSGSQPDASAPDASQGEVSSAADFKVGAIYINGQNDTAGYTFQHHSGITKAMENLGLDGFTQERTSAREEYTPPFDLTGI